MPRRRRRRPRDRDHAGQRPGRARPDPRGGARVPAPVPARALGLPQPRGRAAPTRLRRAHDPRLAADAARAERRLARVELRAQHRHRRRARPWDRLQPPARLALSRGARAARPGRRSGAGDDRDRGQDGCVQLRDRGRRDRDARGLPARVPPLDGHRRRARRPAGGADRADGAARAVHPARSARECAFAGALAAGPGADGGRPKRWLVPPRARADAPARPGGGGCDRAPARARACRSCRSASPAWMPPSCRRARARAWSTRRSATTSRPPWPRRPTRCCTPTRLERGRTRWPSAGCRTPPSSCRRGGSAPGAWELRASSGQPFLADASQRLVRGMRSLQGDALVGGATAQFLDQKHALGSRLAAGGRACSASSRSCSSTGRRSHSCCR